MKPQYSHVLKTALQTYQFCFYKYIYPLLFVHSKIFLKKGTFKHVVDPTKLKDEIGFYYREFVSKENDVATIIFKQYKHLQKGNL